MDFNAILSRIKEKSPVFSLLPLGVSLLLIFLKWQLALPLAALLFLVGVIIGMFFLDIAEGFFNVRPSPFHTQVFVFVLVILSVYVMSSTGEQVAQGLIISTNIQVFLLQLQEWQRKKTLASWYSFMIGSASVELQQGLLFLYGFIIAALGFLFLRA